MLGAVVSTACELTGLVGLAVATFLVAGVPALLIIGSLELILVGIALEPLPKRKLLKRG